MLQAVMRHAIERAGFELIAKWRVPTLPYARRVKALFEHFAITSVIDIGANAGQFRDQMRYEVGFTGPIASFEPDPALAAALARRAASDPAWTVFPVALGAAPGTMPFNVMQNPVYNSFHAPLTEQVGQFGSGNVVVTRTDVQVRTLDAMAEALGDLTHAYLKIDTQGFDLEVLKGGGNVVQQVPALQTEVSLKAQYAGGPTMDQSIAAFAKIGFSVADFFLVSTDSEERAIEFDCIMVRDRQPF